MTINPDTIFPLIIPSSYHEGTTWQLPHINFLDNSVALTWVIIDSSESMVYLTQEEYQELNDGQINWQQVAFENLRNSIADDENFYTQVKMSDDKQRIIFIAFMHSDGIGSSRVLLAYELEQAFPDGYYLAFPDRSCGLVVAKNIKASELIEAKKIVKACYKGATIPMSIALHSAKDFALPEEWIAPIDLNFSEILLKEITKLRPV